MGLPLHILDKNLPQSATRIGDLVCDYMYVRTWVYKVPSSSSYGLLARCISFEFIIESVETYPITDDNRDENLEALIKNLSEKALAKTYSQLVNRAHL